MGNDKYLLLSVIVPIYNVEQYLGRCIHSIITQTYTNLEIILVDDGSPDNCPEKCDDWAKQDSRIKVIHKKNGGLGNARNSGLEIATGDYVAFVDSDDYIIPDMYERLMNEAVRGDFDCIYCGFKQQLPSMNTVDVIEMEETVIYGEDIKKLAGRFLFDFSRNPLNCSVWHGIYRRKLLDFKFVSEREFLSEDLIFTHTFLGKCNSFSYIPKALYHYSYNKKSLSNSYSEKSFKRILATAGKLNEIYRDTVYANQGDAYAFCQVYFLMRFSLIRSRIPVKSKYSIFKNIILDEEYNKILQDKNSFNFAKKRKLWLTKMIYYMHRHKMYRLNFLIFQFIKLIKK